MGDRKAPRWQAATLPPLSEQSGVVTRPASIVVERAKRGDRSAMAVILERHADQLYAHFSGPLHWHDELVPDLVQETMTRAVASFSRFRGASDEDAARWLFGIARNVHLQEVSRRVGIRLRKDVATELGRQESVWREGWCRADIVAALDELPLCQLEVLRLVFEGLSSREIAQQLDLPEGTVASRLYRARERLRARLGIDC